MAANKREIFYTRMNQLSTNILENLIYRGFSAYFGGRRPGGQDSLDKHFKSLIPLEGYGFFIK